MKNPLRARPRFWMSSGLAVVMAAIGGNGFASDHRPRSVSPSRFGLMETAARIEASALRHGLSVFTRMQHRPGVGSDGGEAALIIVLASSQGGTPIVMDSSDERPALPLSVLLRHDASGTLVSIPVPSWDDLPQQMRADLDGLPDVLADAALT